MPQYVLGKLATKYTAIGYRQRRTIVGAKFKQRARMHQHQNSPGTSL